MKGRILVIDDFESIRDFLKSVLEKNGYKVDVANDGEEAWNIINADPSFNLILSDYNMPKLNGMGLLKKIKSNPNTQHLPVMFLTTETDSGEKRTAKSAGLFSWVTKPYKLKSFLSQIEIAVSSSGVTTS